MRRKYALTALTVLLCTLCLFAYSKAGNYDLMHYEIVALDTVVSTNADTTTVTQPFGNRGFFCGPWVVFVKMVELSDSSSLRVLYDYSPDTATYAYVTFDSTITASSTGTAGQTVTTLDTIFTAIPPPAFLRVRVIGGTNNDKGSGVTVRIATWAKNCDD